MSGALTLRRLLLRSALAGTLLASSGAAAQGPDEADRPEPLWQGEGYRLYGAETAVPKTADVPSICETKFEGDIYGWNENGRVALCFKAVHAPPEFEKKVAEALEANFARLPSRRREEQEIRGDVWQRFPSLRPRCPIGMAVFEVRLYSPVSGTTVIMCRADLRNECPKGSLSKRPTQGCRGYTCPEGHDLQTEVVGPEGEMLCYRCPAGRFDRAESKALGRVVCKEAVAKNRR